MAEYLFYFETEPMSKQSYPVAEELAGYCCYKFDYSGLFFDGIKNVSA
jgi:hypothetical protein